METNKKVQHIILPPENAKRYPFNDVSKDYIEIRYDKEVDIDR